MKLRIRASAHAFIWKLNNVSETNLTSILKVEDEATQETIVNAGGKWGMGNVGCENLRSWITLDVLYRLLNTSIPLKIQ
jgi:hypothetical protein